MRHPGTTYGSLEVISDKETKEINWEGVEKVEALRGVEGRAWWVETIHIHYTNI